MANFKLVTSEEDTRHEYRTDLPVYAYIRFSTMAQVKKSIQGKTQQDTRMHEKLVRIGFTHIVKKDRDEGISAQKGTDKRADLADIYAAMKSGQCGGIAAYDASRLWRDRDRVHADDFILKVKKYNVPVILHDRTYWPDSREDMEALHVLFEDAHKGLAQSYDKMNPARQELVLSGSFGGHCVPIGYVVVGEKGDRHYVAYEPHASFIRWLFKRYRQLNGNLGRLGHELAASDFHFPHFDRELLRALGTDIPHIALTHDDKGYKLQSRSGLLSVLTNRAYIGWYAYNAASEESRVFQGEYVNKEAHDAIVSLEDFQYAYSRLSPVTLAGEKNENKPTIDRHYSKVSALLEGVLTSNGVKMYAMADGNYTTRKVGDFEKSYKLGANIAQIDSAFSKAMIAVLGMLKATKNLDLSAKIAALQAETVERVGTLADELEVIDRGIATWELTKRAAIASGYEPDVIDAMKNLKRLHADRDALEVQSKQASSEASELAKSGDLLESATEQWDSFSFENKRRLVKLIVGNADIVEVTPHMLKLTVLLVEPVERLLKCYVYRTRGSMPTYTPEENASVRQCYPRADRRIVLESLPSRSWESITIQAGTLGVNRTTRENTSGIPDNMTLTDAALLKSLGLPAKPLDGPHWVVSTVHEFKLHLVNTRK